MCPIKVTGPGSAAFQSESATVVPECVPGASLCHIAYKYAAENLHLAILNHSTRVWLIAQSVSQQEQSIWTSSEHHRALLFVACILHDIGACSRHDGPQRFEIEAGDYAKDLLLAHDIALDEAHQVWTAIALHTSPQIAERIDPLARLVRIAVVIDFKGALYFPKVIGEAEVGAIEEHWPRCDIEQVLGDTVAEQGVRQPAKAPPSTWPGGLYRFRAERPNWDGVNGAF